jgi:hypothetical protein
LIKLGSNSEGCDSLFHKLLVEELRSIEELVGFDCQFNEAHGIRCFVVMDISYRQGVSKSYQPLVVLKPLDRRWERACLYSFVDSLDLVKRLRKGKREVILHVSNMI